MPLHCNCFTECSTCSNFYSVCFLNALLRSISSFGIAPLQCVVAPFFIRFLLHYFFISGLLPKILHVDSSLLPECFPKLRSGLDSSTCMPGVSPNGMLRRTGTNASPKWSQTEMEPNASPWRRGSLHYNCSSICYRMETPPYVDSTILPNEDSSICYRMIHVSTSSFVPRFHVFVCSTFPKILVYFPRCQILSSKRLLFQSRCFSSSRPFVPIIWSFFGVNTTTLI